MSLQRTHDRLSETKRSPTESLRFCVLLSYKNNYSPTTRERSILDEEINTNSTNMNYALNFFYSFISILVIIKLSEQLDCNTQAGLS